jgi:hypothetical protein
MTGIDGSAVLDSVLFLPAEQGGTRCRVAVYDPDAVRPVVVVAELLDNEGCSITLTFDAIADQVRAWLPRQCEEPHWVERWPERALAALLLRDQVTSAAYLMLQDRGSWRRTPISPATLAGLPRT